MMPVLIGLLYVNEFRSLSDLYDSHIFHFSSSSFKHLVAFFLSLSLFLSFCVFNLPEKKCVHGQIQSTHTNIAVKQSTKARVMFSRFSQSFLFSERLHLPIGAILNYKLTVYSFWFHSLYSEMYVFDMPVWDIVNFNEITLFFRFTFFFLRFFSLLFSWELFVFCFDISRYFFSCFMHKFSMKFYFIDSTKFDYHLHWNTMTKIKNQRKRNKPQARL